MSYRIDEVLRSVQDTAPPIHTTADEIIGRAQKTRTRRRAAAGAGLAACLAVAVTAVTQLGPDPATTGGAQTAAQPGPAASFSAPPAAPTDAPLPVKKIDFSTGLTQYQVGKYQVGPAIKVTDGYTELPVYYEGATWPGDDGTDYPYAVATITVYDQDVFDPTTFGGVGDTTLTIGPEYPAPVGGREGIGRDWTYTSPVDATKKQVVAALAWKYADSAWATFLPNYGGPSLPRAEAVKLVAGLKTAATRDLKVPYRLGYLPKGWQAVAVEQTAAKTTTAVSAVFLHQGPVADPATRIDEVLPGHLKISVTRGLNPGKADYTDKEGLHCTPGRESCTIIRGDYRIGLDGYGGTLSDAEIKRIAEGLQFTDLADQKAWAKVTF